MKSNITRMIPWLFFIIMLSSCGSDSSGGNTLSYDETKSMVIDILNSEEGKKAITEAEKKSGGQGGGAKMQLLSTPEGQQIQLAVKDVLTDPSYPKHLEKMMTDPKFAGDFAKAIVKQNKQIHKDLMKDPEYQTKMVELMNNSDFKKIIIDVLKSPEYRQQSMSIMQESLKSPLFRLELMELMKKVMEEEAKPKEEKKGGGK